MYAIFFVHIAKEARRRRENGVSDLAYSISIRSEVGGHIP